MIIHASLRDNNYLLTGNKVALFHRDKLEIFYYPSDSDSSRVCRGEKRHFILYFFTLLTH